MLEITETKTWHENDIKPLQHRWQTSHDKHDCMLTLVQILLLRYKCATMIWNYFHFGKWLIKCIRNYIYSMQFTKLELRCLIPAFFSLYYKNNGYGEYIKETTTLPEWKRSAQLEVTYGTTTSKAYHPWWGSSWPKKKSWIRAAKVSLLIPWTNYISILYHSQTWKIRLSKAL